MKKFLFLILILFIASLTAFAEEDTYEVKLDASPIKINTRTREDMIKPHSATDISYSKNNSENYGRYNPDNAYDKKSTSFKREKRFKNVDVGAQLDSTFTPESASQTKTFYAKTHLNDKINVNTSYAVNSVSTQSSQMNGTVSVAPEYRFNQHLSVQNKYSKNTTNGMTKEEVSFKLNPFKDRDRMDLSAGVGQVQYTNGSPSSSQINFGTNFKF